jgi:hypothetical protein
MAAAPSFRVDFFVALVALLTAAVPGVAAAQDQAAVNKVTQLNKKALDAYQNQDYEAARALLKEALELCASAGLVKHPIRARTHIHFGVVAIVGFKQREVGLKQFRKALEVQPDIKLTKSLANPELQDAFEEAVLAAGGDGGGGGGGATAGGGEGGEGSEGGGAQATDDGGDDGDGPPKIRRPPPPRKKSGDDEPEVKGQSGSFFIAMTGGTGFGLIKGQGELDPVLHKLDAPGFAMAQTAQATPEVGFFVTHELLLSAQLRLQYVGGLNGKPPRTVPNNNTPCGSDNYCSPGNGAMAFFVKATYLMLEAPFHVSVGGQIGGGNIRHALEFPDDKTCKASATDTQTQSCVDTLAGGPFLVGPTLGIWYELGDTVDFIFAVNTALGVPNFTFNFDLSLGLGFRI